MNTIHLHLLNASGNLTDLESKVHSAFQAATEKAVQLIDLSKVDVVAMDSPERTIADSGVGGYGSINSVELYLDPLKDIEQSEIYATLLHEFHHCMRWRDPGYGNNLRDAIVTEGLALLFEEDVTGETAIFSQEDISNIDVKELKNELDNTNYDHYRWVIIGDEEIPRWLGYTLGYRIVKDYAERYQTTAAKLVSIPTNNIFQSK